MQNPIYTIGYGNRNLSQLLQILQSYSIMYLIDVRSSPYSEYNKEFNKEILAKFLKDHGIKYVYMGDLLGGRPKDLSCYVDGNVIYSEVKKKSFYIEGINRLKTAYNKNLLIALMCSEIDPCNCHRSKLIGETLSSQNIDVRHINRDGLLETQEEVMIKVGKGFTENLFGEIELQSRKKYKREKN